MLCEIFLKLTLRLSLFRLASLSSQLSVVAGILGRAECHYYSPIKAGSTIPSLDWGNSVGSNMWTSKCRPADTSVAIMACRTDSHLDQCNRKPNLA